MVFLCRNSCYSHCVSRYQYNVPNRTCFVGSYIDKQCNIKESAWSERDRSSCKACSRKQTLAPGYRIVPCTGASTWDDSGYEACPNLPNGM